MYRDFKGTLIILVRHGECEGNIKGMFRGRADFSLNKRGIIQASFSHQFYYECLSLL